MAWPEWPWPPQILQQIYATVLLQTFGRLWRRQKQLMCAVSGRRAISYAIDIDISIISAPADSAMSPAALWRHVYVTHHQDDVVSEGGCEEENKAYQVQLGRLCRLHVLQVRVWEGESFVACRYVAMGVHVFYMLILNVGKTAKISRKTSLDFRYCY